MDSSEARSNDTITKYYVAGTRLIASRQQTNTQFASAAAGAPVRVAARSILEPAAVVLVLRRDVQIGVAAAILLGSTGLILAPRRRRQRVVGVVVRDGHAIGMALSVGIATFPWPILLFPAPAEADCGPALSAYHYHQDALGSTHLITGPNGNPFEHLRYTPYGQPRRYDSAYQLIGGDERYRREFTGYETELTSGLAYAGARFYDPLMGMFLTHDPARQFASPYTYTNWNPVNAIDPSGASAEGIIIGIIFGLVAGALTGGIQAAVNGASVADAFKAAAIGGAIGAVSASIGSLVLQPVLASLVFPVVEGLNAGVSAEVVASYILIGAGIGQSSYSLSQGDYASGAIGLGLSIASLIALTQGANSVQRTGSGDTNEWGDLYDLAFAEKTRVEQGTTEYETLSRAAGTIRHESTRAGVQSRLDEGGFVVFDQAKGKAPAFTFRETTYVARTSLDLQPRHLGVHLAHEQFHFLDRAILPQNAWFERRADWFSLQAFDSRSNAIYPTSQDLYRGALERYPWPWSR